MKTKKLSKKIRFPILVILLILWIKKRKNIDLTDNSPRGFLLGGLLYRLIFAPKIVLVFNFGKFLKNGKP